MDVRLVYDAGPTRGLGHRRRMEALAEALDARGVTTELAPTDSGPSHSRAAVIDSYDARADDYVRFPVDVVVAVDDLLRDLAVDLVVDAAPGAQPSEHRSAHRALTGPAYALVDPALGGLARRPISDRARSFLVTMGGADARGIGARVAADLRGLLPDDAVVRLVVGPWGADGAVAGVETVRSPSGLGHLIAGADVVVTAGGVAMLECLRLGRPTVGVVTAENQRRYVEGAARVRAVVPASAREAGAAAARLALDHRLRQMLSAAGSTLIDGNGADRVAEEIVELL